MMLTLSFFVYYIYYLLLRKSEVVAKKIAVIFTAVIFCVLQSKKENWHFSTIMVKICANYFTARAKNGAQIRAIATVYIIIYIKTVSF